MPIISKDSIQILFTARDRVSGPLRTATTAMNKLVTSSGRAIKNLTAMGARKLVGGLRSLGSALGSLTGIGALLGGGGLSVLVGQGLRVGDELAKTADKIGATTEELGRLNFAFSQTTTLSDQGVGTSLQRLQKRLGDFALNGAGPAAKALETLGLDAQTLIDSGLENSIFTIADALENVEGQALRVKLVDSLFGKEGVGLINALDEGSDGLRALGEQATALGITFEREALGRIEQVNDQLGRISDIVRGAGIAFAAELAPRILTAAQALEQWIIQQGGVKVVVDQIITAASNGIDRLQAFGEGLVTIFDGVRDAINGTRNFIQIAGAEAKVVAAELAEFNNIGIGANGRAREAELEAQTDQARRAVARLRQPEIEIGVNLDEVELETRIGELQSRFNDLLRTTQSGDLGRAELIRAEVEMAAYGRAIGKARDELDLFGLATDDVLTIPTITGTPSSVSPTSTTPATDPLAEIRQQQQQAQRDAEAAAALRQQQLAREQRQREVETARQSISTLRGQLDEELGIIQDFDQRVANLRSNAATAGLSTADTDGLVAQINQQRVTALEEYYQRERDLIAQNAQAEKDRIAEAVRLQDEQFNQRQAASNLNVLANFDVTQSLENGRRQLRELFTQELKEINLAVNIPLEERQKLIAQAADLTKAAEAELQINARLSLANDVAGVATGVLGSIASLQQPDDNSALRTRADEEKAIRADLLSALQSGNDAEVASLEAKLSTVAGLHSKEEQQAKKRFERYQKTQRSIATVAALTTANQVFQETPGFLPIRLAAAGLALAAGLKNAKRIGDQEYNSASGGGGSFGSGGSSGGSTVTDQQLQDARNGSSNDSQTVTRNVVVNLPFRRGQLVPAEYLEDMWEQIQDGIEAGDLTVKTNFVGS